MDKTFYTEEDPIRFPEDTVYLWRYVDKYFSQPGNIITYKAANKLAESTAVGSKVSGFNPLAFGDAKMVSHTFENGIGTIKFDRIITTVTATAFGNCTVTDIIFPSTINSINSYLLQAVNLSPGQSSKLYLCFDDVTTNTSTLLYNVSVGELYIIVNKLTVAALNCIILGDYYLHTVVMITTPSILPQSGSYSTDKYFYECPTLVNSGNIYVPKEQLSGYKNNTKYSNVSNKITSLGEIHLYGDHIGLIDEDSIIYQKNKGLETIIYTNTPSVQDNLFLNNKFIEGVDFVGITQIGDSSFEDCHKIKRQVNLSEINSIGSNAFKGCKNVESFKIESQTVPTIGENAFDDTGDCPIYVIESLMDDYIANANWSKYASRLLPITTSCYIEVWKYQDVVLQYPEDKLEIYEFNTDRMVGILNEQLITSDQSSDLYKIDNLFVGVDYYIKPVVTSQAALDALPNNSKYRDSKDSYFTFRCTSDSYDNALLAYLYNFLEYKTSFSNIRESRPTTYETICYTAYAYLGDMIDVYDGCYSEHGRNYINDLLREYSASHGGLYYLSFNDNNKVSIRNVNTNEEYDYTHHDPSESDEYDVENYLNQTYDGWWLLEYYVELPETPSPNEIWVICD